LPSFLASVGREDGGSRPRGGPGPTSTPRRRRPDLALAVADEPQRDRLHAARGEPAAHLVPEDRADLVAHQPVEDAPGLLRVDLLLVDLAGVLERVLDRALRDLVEDHAADLLLAALMPSSSARCQQMASPSRSGSAAR
jgi:hypothetical protein